MRRKLALILRHAQMDFMKILKVVFASDALLFVSFVLIQLQCALNVKMATLENIKARAV